MTISSDIINLSLNIANQNRIPRVSSLFLPPITDTDEIKDEFGFIFLDDGSIGPFYVSLPGELEALWQHYPNCKIEACDVMELITKLNGGSLIERAIAIGAYNALSDHVYRASGYFPANLNGSTSSMVSSPKVGDRIGMVGYFEPVIRRLLKQGIEVLVLELNPQRVKPEQGVTVTTTLSDLASCQYIICTASTLINDTLESTLEVKRESATLVLTGPSSSGLPDVVFNYGVDAVGGVYFPDIEALKDILSRHESWKDAGEKYQIDAVNYPGIEALLLQ